ncbi:Propanediol utilization protein PduA [compost metagenome]
MQQQEAIGLIETIGYTTAVSAADAALKAANVTLEAVEKVIGVGGMLGVTIQLGGDVAAVKSAVEAGSNEAERVGKLISSHVIPRAHQEVLSKLVASWSPALVSNAKDPEASGEQDFKPEAATEGTEAAEATEAVEAATHAAEEGTEAATDVITKATTGRQSSSSTAKAKANGEADQTPKNTK